MRMSGCPGLPHRTPGEARGQGGAARGRGGVHQGRRRAPGVARGRHAPGAVRGPAQSHHRVSS